MVLKFYVRRARRSTHTFRRDEIDTKIAIRPPADCVPYSPIPASRGENGKKVRRYPMAFFESFIPAGVASTG